ncbi:outer membrane lipoprotein carrier protein [Legionella beliardensis]|uniref:Outer-membrane lipoprotein carrier protein n=1 Tax=Legionella beliardensis TaxID=91822 RepID=A0A378I2G5_9GAMM|nr:outer membrane lipoprotein chaperone LolA [Legionella beliardensis]STX29387.1 outer membrane lipoprotein carrier protein [Legionella beliardensis]
MRKLLTLLLIICIPSVWADTPAAEVQAKLNAIHSMSANFDQIVTAGKREVSQTSGKMALVRPGRFRWETKSPLEQLVVADSKQLWVYDIDLEQVTVKKQEQGLGGTPGLFLSGYDNTVTRDFDVTAKDKDGVRTYILKAKSPKENFQTVHLTFNKDALSLIEFFDQLGQHTIVKLKNIKTNPSLATKLFQFKPPKGVDVVEQ